MAKRNEQELEALRSGPFLLCLFFRIILSIQSQSLLQETVFFLQRLIELGKLGQLRLQRLVSSGSIENVLGETIALSWEATGKAAVNFKSDVDGCVWVWVCVCV